MSAQHPEEDLIDYEEDDTTTIQPAQAANGGAAASTDGAAGESKDQKGSYVGIHSTGFRDFLLKPELLRAISDLGFEHPSEGESLPLPGLVVLPAHSFPPSISGGTVTSS